MNGRPIVWNSKKQACVATSTTQTKYATASLSTKEIVWAWRLMETLGFVHIGATPLWIDNQGLIKLVHNPKFHRITKHIGIQYHVIWEVTLTYWIKRYLFSDVPLVSYVFPKGSQLQSQDVLQDVPNCTTLYPQILPKVELVEPIKVGQRGDLL